MKSEMVDTPTKPFDGLPAVGGDMCEWSINEFERRCRICIQREQEKPLPDNDLIAVLCNAVRIGRELGMVGTRLLKHAMGNQETK